MNNNLPDAIKQIITDEVRIASTDDDAVLFGIDDAVNAILKLLPSLDSNKRYYEVIPRDGEGNPMCPFSPDLLAIETQKGYLFLLPVTTQTTQQ